MGFMKRWVGNKKAQDITTTMFYLLFGLVLAGFFIIAVMMRVKDAVNDTTYHKRFYARDLALLVDAMHASNGAFSVKYEMGQDYLTNQYKLKPNYLPFGPAAKIEKVTESVSGIALEAFIEPGRVFITDLSDKPVDKRAQTSFLFGSSSDTGVKKSSVTNNVPDFRVALEADRNFSFTDQATILALPATPQTTIITSGLPWPASSQATSTDTTTAEGKTWVAGDGGEPSENKKILNKAMDEMNYNDASLRAGLAAIIQGESGFRAITENMNYNGARLMQVFPSRFSSQAEADELASKGPEAIANYLYGTGNTAMQLGNTELGDGWKYIGRGFIQLTGKANYARYSRVAGVDLVEYPEALTDPLIAARVAVGYIIDRTKGNTFDDQLKAVGGSEILWAQKKEYYQLYLRSGDFAPGSTYYG